MNPQEAIEKIYPLVTNYWETYLCERCLHKIPPQKKECTHKKTFLKTNNTILERLKDDIRKGIAENQELDSLARRYQTITQFKFQEGNYTYDSDLLKRTNSHSIKDIINKLKIGSSFLKKQNTAVRTTHTEMFLYLWADTHFWYWLEEQKESTKPQNNAEVRKFSKITSNPDARPTALNQKSLCLLFKYLDSNGAFHPKLPRGNLYQCFEILTGYKESQASKSISKTDVSEIEGINQFDFKNLIKVLEQITTQLEDKRKEFKLK